MAAHRFIKSFAALPKLRDALIELRDAMESLEARASIPLREVCPDHRASARNLIHYLAMRRKDLRAMQSHLLTLGLSSLVRAESAALPAVSTVIQAVDRILGNQSDGVVREAAFDQSFGVRTLARHARELLGEPRPGQHIRIMVTAPAEAAWNYQRMLDLVEHGMDCLRIDCGQDGRPTWLGMIRNLQRARCELGSNCLLLMDLAGPEARTGRIEDATPVLKVRPQRDSFGRVTKPARVWITVAGSSAGPRTSATECLYVDAAWLATLQPGDSVRFLDTRGRRRRLEVIERLSGGVLAETNRTAYVTSGTRLSRPGSRKRKVQKTTLVGIEARKGHIRLHVGDEIILTYASTPGVQAVSNMAGKVVSPARVSCSSSESLRQVKVGDRISIDDGQLSGVGVSVSDEGVRVRIERASPRGTLLTADMRLHFPDSGLDCPAITPLDAENVEFIAAHADLIGMSSTRDEFDVQSLIEHLAACPGSQPGIVVRIETRRGFERLPAILMRAMRYPRFGILVSREDLALECGHDRLASVQEEIVRICEAAHCPTLWSTQTLEGMIKTGVRSRAEITDAAMSQPGQCIELCRGPHVDDALCLLVQTLRHVTHDPSREAATPLRRPPVLDLGGFRSTRDRSDHAVLGIHRRWRSAIESGTTDLD